MFNNNSEESKEGMKWKVRRRIIYSSGVITLSSIGGGSSWLIKDVGGASIGSSLDFRNERLWKKRNGIKAILWFIEIYKNK